MNAIGLFLLLATREAKRLNDRIIDAYLSEPSFTAYGRCCCSVFVRPPVVHPRRGGQSLSPRWGPMILSCGIEHDGEPS